MIAPADILPTPTGWDVLASDGYGGWAGCLSPLSRKQLDPTEDPIPAIHDDILRDEQQEHDPREALELLVVFGIDLAFLLGLLHLVDLFLQRVQGRVGVVGADIDAFASGGYLLTHLFVESGDDHVAVVVLHVVAASTDGDGRAFGLPDADDVDADASIGSGFGGLHGGVLMVLAVGDQQDGLTRLVVRREGTQG